jgi:hypothetical protein
MSGHCLPCFPLTVILFLLPHPVGFRKRRQILFYRKTFSYAAAVMLVLFAVKGLIQPVIPSLPEEPAVYMMEVSSHNDVPPRSN